MTRPQLSRFTVLFMIVLSVFAVSCRRQAPAPPPAAAPPPPAPPPPAPTITLRADRTTIDRGQNLTLTWEVRNAASVRIEPGLGAVNVNGGTQQVTPPSSVTYTATATGPGGQASDVARITVNIPPPPPPVETRVTPPTTVTIDSLFADNMRPILFDYDQSDIRSDQIGQLQSNANFLRQQPSVRFTIEGHADERGSQEYNIGLGDRRASAVKQYLAAQGIPETRMNVVSFGEERPDCRDTSEACYARNRRAAFAMIR